MKKNYTIDYLLLRAELQALLGFCESVTTRLPSNDRWGRKLLHYVNIVDDRLAKLPINSVKVEGGTDYETKGE